MVFIFKNIMKTVNHLNTFLTIYKIRLAVALTYSRVIKPPIQRADSTLVSSTWIPPIPLQTYACIYKACDLGVKTTVKLQKGKVNSYDPLKFHLYKVKLLYCYDFSVPPPLYSCKIQGNSRSIAVVNIFHNTL